MKSFESLEVICDHHNDGPFTIDMHLRTIRGLGLGALGTHGRAGHNVHLYGGGPVVMKVANHF